MFKFIFIFYFFSFYAFAETKVKASVDPSLVSPKDTLTFTVEVEHGLLERVRPPRLPPMGGFRILRQFRSLNIQITGSNMRGLKQYKYILQPLKEGKLQIGSVEVVVGGKVYKTSPVEVEVSSKVKPLPSPSPSPSPFGGLGQLLPHVFFDEEDKDGFPFFPGQQQPIPEEDIFIKLEMKKSTLYIGEMALAEWFLYLPGNQAVNVRNEVAKNAKLDGFWVESVVAPADSASVPHTAERKGNKIYRKQLLMSSALFPVRTGILNVGALKVKSSFMNFFSVFSAPRIRVRESEAKQIKVLSLLDEGKGKFFTEAVGDFNISVDVSKKVISVQEPTIYKVVFKGKGHPRLIRLPDLPFGDAFEVYDITESQAFSVSKSVKTFEIILIPKSSGDLVIPSFELTTFDPQLGIYKTHILPEVKVKVVGVAVPGRSKDKSALYFESDTDTKKEKESEGKEKGVGKTELTPLMKETTNNFFVKNKRYFWIVIYALLFILLLIASVKNFLFVRKDNIPFKAQLSAGLKRVDRAIKKKQWKESGIELNQLMYSFFTDISGRDKVVKNWDILLKNIKPSIRIKYESQIRALASRLERLSFASAEEARELRNERNVLKLKKDLVGLIQKISTEYSID